LRELEVQQRTNHRLWTQQGSHGEQPIGIWVGGDETFYGLPILVAMELASGFIFSEVECENRTYQTWWAQVSEWFNQGQWDCRGLDGAKALVKLALSGLGCPSLPDMFHLLYALSKSIGSAIARQQVQLQNSTKAYKRNSSSHLCRHL